MSKYLKAIATIILIPLLKLYKESAVKVFKMKAEALYVNSVRSVRSLYLSTLCIICCLIVMAMGFIMLNVVLIIGCFIILGKKLAIVSFVILGLIYFFIPLHLIRRSCLEETWMQFSDARRVIDKLTTPIS